jgi:hypothetical protein
MVSGFDIEYLLDDLYVSYRLQQHFSFFFFIRRFPPRRDWTFDVRCSFSVSYSIKLAAFGDQRVG